MLEASRSAKETAIPGDRVTQQKRRQIASGLADGLASAEIARGAASVGVLGPRAPAATRLENVARFLDFVGEAITRAAEQAREILYTKPGTTSDGTTGPRSDQAA